MNKKPFALVILDGLGCSNETKYNPFAQARLPNLKKWLKQYPSTILKASGTDVGLLPNMHGNSAVGLLTIGAGRVIPQPIKEIHDDIENGKFFNNLLLNRRLEELEQSNHALHIIGLLSDAAVHSSLDQLKALLKVISKYKIDKVYIHAFLDGRDTLPISAEKFLADIDKFWLELTGKKTPFASLHGRFYAMDRDKNWERTLKTFTLLTGQNIDGNKFFKNWSTALKYWYDQNITDEFIPPTLLENFTSVSDNDGLICFNIRADRSRQIIELFLKSEKDQNKLKNITLAWIITFTEYNPEFNVDVLYPPKKIKNTLSDQLALFNQTMFYIAESEKYAHITYFFNGGRELIRDNETRVLIPSKSLGKTYAKNPEMSAPEITKSVIDSVRLKPNDFYLINYANADMVGHSGNFQATKIALETLDNQLKKLFEEIVEKKNGTLCITADHGNAEVLYDEQANQPNTSHTANPVFFILINKQLKFKNIQLSLIGLADIAPFILKFLNITVPNEMIKKLNVKKLNCEMQK